MTEIRHLRLLLSLWLLLTAAGCATDPVTGDRRFSVVDWTTEEEVKLGETYAPSVESQFDAVFPDRKANAYLGTVIRELAQHSARKDLDFRFKILDSSIPNAFALPGGHVYITRGLLEKTETQGQFVFVMGHEIGHVEHRHAMYNQSRGKLSGIATAPLRLAVSVTDGLPGGNAVGLAASLAAAPLTLWGLKYSRGQEAEADQRGVYFAAEMGYDPREGEATFRVFERLEKESGGEGTPSLLRTHPLNADRIEAIEKETREKYPELLKKPHSAFRKDDPRFHAIVQRLRKTAPAYKLHDEAEKLLTSDDLTPEKITTAEKKLQQASEMLPYEPLFAIGLGEVAFQRERFEDARPHLERAVKLYDTLTPGDGNWKAFFYLGILELRAGKGPSAVKRLEKARSYFPVQPAVHFFLASAYEMAGDAVRARDSYQKVLQLTSRRSDLYREARRRLQRL